MDLDHHNGQAIEGWPHVVQSIETILRTRLNSRVFVRQFGSDLPAMVDMPMNDANVLAVYVAVAEAIERWEPRFELSDVALSGAETGIVTLELTGNHLPNAHRGDPRMVVGERQVVRVQGTRVENWSLVA